MVGFISTGPPFITVRLATRNLLIHVLHCPVASTSSIFISLVSFCFSWTTDHSVILNLGLEDELL